MRLAGTLPGVGYAGLWIRDRDAARAYDDIDEYLAFNESDDYPSHRVDLYEHKPGDWGYLNGKPVVVDYAVQVHVDEFAAIQAGEAKSRQT